MSLMERSVDNGAVEVEIAAGKKLACLVCAQCGYIHWFLNA